MTQLNEIANLIIVLVNHYLFFCQTEYDSSSNGFHFKKLVVSPLEPNQRALFVYWMTKII